MRDIHVRCTDEQHERLRELAKAEVRSLANYLLVKGLAAQVVAKRGPARTSREDIEPYIFADPQRSGAWTLLEGMACPYYGMSYLVTPQTWHKIYNRARLSYPNDADWAAYQQHQQQISRKPEGIEREDIRRELT